MDDGTKKPTPIIFIALLVVDNHISSVINCVINSVLKADHCHQ